MPAVGYLVGDVHNGIAQMFTVIEHARMTVGTKAVGTLSTGYLNALAYAKERVQGADMTQIDRQGRPAGDDHSPPGCAPQPDDAEGLRRRPARPLHVRRRASERRCRTACFGRGSEMAHRVDDLLLPVVKGVGSERAYEI